jgi:hypothetical protein
LELGSNPFSSTRQSAIAEKFPEGTVTLEASATGIAGNFQAIFTPPILQTLAALRPNLITDDEDEA